MNQILELPKKKKQHLLVFKLQFLLFLLITAIIFVIFLYNTFSKINSNKSSSLLLKKYSISKLYSSSTIHSLKINNISLPIIGSIEIPAININYPILSTWSDSLLKISVCKFYGSNINSYGNLCIIGHNYNTNDFFSNLDLLNIGDEIILYDLHNIQYFYYVYSIEGVDFNDMSYLTQDDSFLKEVTLITCNNLNRQASYCKSKRRQIALPSLLNIIKHYIL